MFFLKHQVPTEDMEEQAKFELALSDATNGAVPISSWAASLQQPRDRAVTSWPCEHFLALAVGACRNGCCSTAKRAPPKKPRAPPKKRTAAGPAPGEREETRHRAMHSPILAAHAEAVERWGAGDAHVPPAERVPPASDADLCASPAQLSEGASDEGDGRGDGRGDCGGSRGGGNDIMLVAWETAIAEAIRRLQPIQLKPDSRATDGE